MCIYERLSSRMGTDIDGSYHITSIVLFLYHIAIALLTVLSLFLCSNWQTIQRISQNQGQKYIGEACDTTDSKAEGSGCSYYWRAVSDFNMDYSTSHTCQESSSSAGTTKTSHKASLFFWFRSFVDDGWQRTVGKPG